MTVYSSVAAMQPHFRVIEGMVNKRQIEIKVICPVISIMPKQILTILTIEKCNCSRLLPQQTGDE